MKYTLITTTTCPKCPAVKEHLYGIKDIDLTVFDERTIGYGDLIAKHSLSMAPSLIVEHDDEVFVYAGADDIMENIK